MTRLWTGEPDPRWTELARWGDDIQARIIESLPVDQTVAGEWTLTGPDVPAQDQLLRRLEAECQRSVWNLAPTFLYDVATHDLDARSAARGIDARVFATPDWVRRRPLMSWMLSVYSTVVVAPVRYRAIVVDQETVLVQSVQSVDGVRRWWISRTGSFHDEILRHLSQLASSGRHLWVDSSTDSDRRRLRVMLCVYAGMPNKQIASVLGASLRVVETDIQWLKSVAGITGRGGFAIDAGIDMARIDEVPWMTPHAAGERRKAR